MPGSNDFSMAPELMGETSYDAPVNTSKPVDERQKAYNTRWSNYLTNLGNTLRRINIKKARKSFDLQFERDWNNLIANRNLNNSLQQSKLQLKSLISKFRLDMAGILSGANSDVEALQNEIIQNPIKEFNTNYWLGRALKVNPNFKSIDDVKAWLRQNGLVDDGMFGSKSLAKWNELNLKPLTILETSIGDITTPITGSSLVSSPLGRSAILGAISLRLTTPLPQIKLTGFLNWLNGLFSNNPNNRNKMINRNSYFLQGGKMNNQEELQKAFLAFLIQDAAEQGILVLSEQDLQQYAQQLGEEGMQAKYQEFMQKMLGGVMARLGAKLQYYKKLKGLCPDGEELVYFEKGGRICKACLKALTGSKVEKPKKKMNEVQKFKEGRKRLDPKTTKNLPNGKYPSYWTSDERITWEREHGDMQDGAGAVKNKGIGKNACGKKLMRK